MWTYALMVLISVGQDPTEGRDAAAIHAARQAIVGVIEPTLPRLSFEEWLWRVVGKEATIKWEVNDCGEQSGDPNQDRIRDIPMCVEVQVDLGSDRELHVSLAVGSLKKGVEGVPQFWSAYVRRAGGSPQWLKGMGGVSSTIRAGTPSTGRLPINE